VQLAAQREARSGMRSLHLSKAQHKNVEAIVRAVQAAVEASKRRLSWQQCALAQHEREAYIKGKVPSGK
jgi:hypothetical protein